jgi:hypothetical protein
MNLMECCHWPALTRQIVEDLWAPETQTGLRRLPGGGPSLAEPVSGGRIPGDREKKREFLLFGLVSTKCASERPELSKYYARIPYVPEPGIHFPQTGNFISGTGTLERESERIIRPLERRVFRQMILVNLPGVPFGRKNRFTLLA